MSLGGNRIFKVSDIYVDGKLLELQNAANTQEQVVDDDTDNAFVFGAS